MAGCQSGIDVYNSFLTSRAGTPWKRIGLFLIGGIGGSVFQVAETWVFKIRKHKKTLSSELKAERWKSDKKTLRSFGSPSCDSVL